MNSFYSLVSRPFRALYSLLRHRRGTDGMWQEGPPDLDEVLRKLRQSLQRLLGGGDGGGNAGNGSSGGGGSSSGGHSTAGMYGLLSIALMVLGVYVLYHSVHIIDEQERGVVLRFGKHATTINPGLNIRFPPPIERVYKVNVSKVHRHEHKDALMLTSDENLVTVTVAVQFRISDPEAFIFNVEDPENTLVKSVESAVREEVGKNKIDFVITDGRRELSENQEKLLQQTLERYGTGIEVVGFELQEAKAPEEVSAAFDDAVNAREDSSRLVEEAEAYRNDIIPRARGTAARLAEEAEAYKARVVESARGEADRFLAQYEAYTEAPGVTRRRLYLDTMQQVLQVTSKTMITDSGTSPLIYLPLDKMLEAGRSRANNPGSHDGSSSGTRRADARFPGEATPPSTENSRRRASR